MNTNAVAFKTRIRDGKINIPQQYRKDFSSLVQVVLVQEDTMRADAQNNTASPEEKINGIDPQEQKRALELFHKKLDAIADEPLGEEFDKAINAGRCRAKKGEERLDFIRGTR